jgi:hypothetical protein
LGYNRVNATSVRLFCSGAWVAVRMVRVVRLIAFRFRGRAAEPRRWNIVVVEAST